MRHTLRADGGTRGIHRRSLRSSERINCLLQSRGTGCIARHAFPQQGGRICCALRDRFHGRSQRLSQEVGPAGLQAVAYCRRARVAHTQQGIDHR